MTDSDTGENGERTGDRPSETPGARRPRSPEAVRLADIALEDTTYQSDSCTPSQELRAGLEREGQREPVDLVGAEPPYRIVDGFRRIAAAHGLGWHSIEARVHRGISEAEAWRIAVTRNAARKELSMAIACTVLVRRSGLGPAEIAALLGLPRRRVDLYLKYRRRPES